MQVGKIRCDLCHFVSDLETFNGKAQMRTPEGWATVSAMIRVAGEHKLERENKQVLKNKIAKEFPTLHICPGCISSGRIFEASRLLPMMHEKKTGGAA